MHDLATTLQTQNEELSIEKGMGPNGFKPDLYQLTASEQVYIPSIPFYPVHFTRQLFDLPGTGHVHSIKADNANSSTGMQGQLNASRQDSAAEMDGSRTTV